jgi:hypothetical protein
MRWTLLRACALLLWVAAAVAQPTHNAGWVKAAASQDEARPDRCACLNESNASSTFTSMPSMPQTAYSKLFDDGFSGNVARRTPSRPPAGPKCYACVPSVAA